MIVALDTSALGKLLVREDETAALNRYLVQRSGAGDAFCVSSLAVTELRRLGIRLDIPSDTVDDVLQRFTVIRLTEAVLQLAGRLPHPHLRTLDAIHIAGALVVEAGALLTYDIRQAAAARLEGLVVSGPSDQP